MNTDILLSVYYTKQDGCKSLQPGSSTP